MSTTYTAEHAEKRESLLDAAIAAGKFPESRRARYAALYDSNSTYATNLIAMLAPGLPPAQVAHRSTAPAAATAHRSLLSDSERRRIAAAERGERQVITRIHD